MKRAEVAFSGCRSSPTAEDIAKHPGLVKRYIGPGAAGAPCSGLEGSTGIPPCSTACCWGPPMVEWRERRKPCRAAPWLRSRRRS